MRDSSHELLGAVWPTAWIKLCCCHWQYCVQRMRFARRFGARAANPTAGGGDRSKRDLIVVNSRFWIFLKKVFGKAFKRASTFLSGIRRLQDNIVGLVEPRWWWWSIKHFVFVRLKYFWWAKNKIDRGKETTDSDKRSTVWALGGDVQLKWSSNSTICAFFSVFKFKIYSVYLKCNNLNTIKRT